VSDLHVQAHSPEGEGEGDFYKIDRDSQEPQPKLMNGYPCILSFGQAKPKKQGNSGVAQPCQRGFSNVPDLIT